MKVELVLAPNPSLMTGPGTNTWIVSSGGGAVVIDRAPSSTVTGSFFEMFARFSKEFDALGDAAIDAYPSGLKSSNEDTMPPEGHPAICHRRSRSLSPSP